MEEIKMSGCFGRRSFLKGAAAAMATTASAGLLAACATNTQNLSDTSAPQGASAGPAAADWLGVPPSISDSDCAETIECDVLVCGAGTAGYFAACAAAEAGAHTLLIDKGEAGNGVRSSALAAIGTKKQKEAGSSIDKLDIINDFANYANNRNDMRLLRLWADESAEAIDWYTDLVESNGMFVEAETNMPSEPTRYHMWPTGHGTVLELGKNGHVDGQIPVENRIVEICNQYLAEHGGEFAGKHELKMLIKDGNKVVGAYATNADGDYVRINASKGVILATGGFGSNQEMYEALQPEICASLAGLMAFPTCTGDGIKAGIWAGGVLEQAKSSVLFCRAIVTNDVEIGKPFETPYEYFAFSEQPFLKVGIDGNRLCNESSPYSYVAYAAAKTRDRAWYPIWDSNWKEDVERFHTIGCSTLIFRDGGCHDPGENLGIESVEAQMNDLVDRGYVVKADTVEELAAGLGIDDAATLAKTIDRYNELYDKGEDEDFGKDPFRLSALRTPPFYGMRVGGQLLCTLQGLLVDTNLQVLDEERNPIEGLYAIGNDQGGYYNGVYPNFAAGANAGRCATLGRVAGKHAATR